MSEVIFKTLVEPKKATKKWLFFPVSLVLHGLMVAAIMVVPYLTADSMPTAQIHNVLMVAPPPVPPAPPPPPKPRTGTKGDRKPKPKPEKVKPVTQARFVAPIEVPSEIEEEDIDFGFDGGVDGGVEGGVEGGVAGGVLGSLASGGDDFSQMRAERITTIQRPKLMRQVNPQYPPTALRARIEGIVIVEAVTDIYGKVIRTRIINGHPLFRSAAQEAVRKWMYEPYIINGIPKPVMFTVTVNFRLNNAN
ncbi:MAG: energy transducer TonB [bacterium]|nr:energy transducer TonB [bacterium]